MIAKKIFKKYISLVIILMPKFFIAYYIFLNLTVILKKKSFSCRLLILDKDRFREDEVALSKYTDIEFFLKFLENSLIESFLFHTLLRF